MKLLTTISLMAALVFASSLAQHGDMQEESEEYWELERRQAKDYDQDATAAATQAPAITTIWMQVAVGSTVTYKAFTVTQTFAAVPDQWPTPASGEIGYGTLIKTKKDKRDAEPTGEADVPVVVEAESVGVTEWIQPYVTYTEVQYEAVWIPSNSTNSTSLGNETASGNETAPSNETSPSNETMADYGALGAMSTG